MQAFSFLIQTVFDLYLMVILMRIWLQVARADFYNPLSQFVVKATNPVLVPLRRIIPGFAGIDMGAVVLGFVVVLLKWVLLTTLVSQASFDVVTLLTISAVNLLKEAGMLLFWVLLLQAILSWVSQGRSPIEAVLQQLTAPILAPIRRIIPAVGGLDFSVLVLFIALNFLNILFSSSIPFWSQL